jgi:Holliday junction resolvase RusA-like endonuclease
VTPIEGRRILRVSYPTLPPSEDRIRQIRWIRRGGQTKTAGITYTAEAEGYRKEFQEYMRKHYFVELMKFRKGHKDGNVYSLRLIFHFRPEQALNKTWLEKVAKSPYKKMDLGNRRKLLEDCLSACIDIDDSLFFSVEMYKVIYGEVGVEMVLEPEDPSLFGVPEEYFDGT